MHISFFGHELGTSKKKYIMYCIFLCAAWIFASVDSSTSANLVILLWWFPQIYLVLSE